MTSSPPPQPDPGAREVPTCYRHPKREAYVRCTRCEKHICPDCMREAAVGHQCVECVADGQRGIRQARTVFGGKVTTAPYVTYVLLVLMGLGFVVQMADPQVTGAFGMAGAPVAMGEWYRMITAAFLHGGIGHLLLNGFVLFVFGRQLEAALGHGRYLSLWLLSALGGSVLTLLASPLGQLSVGASGAIFGLVGAILVMSRRLRLDTRFLLVLVAVNLVFTFLVPQISWTAHIGGLVSGLLLGAVYSYLPTAQNGGSPQARTLVHVVATAGFAVLLLALAVAGAVFALG
ncbi:rhomboid family intramembrane serine protease [Allosalinactinospora lopnorensis]|uniref:rhomboid family intramembrane serine protease n=1 Tax=Allosalinactinospora lopnorensis TaxID=1352348 RepID=UPI000623D4D1|nr:rhomboid family intramembrane serine protease [Allosalinactinospora lopnorensis]